MTRQSFLSRHPVQAPAAFVSFRMTEVSQSIAQRFAAQVQRSPDRLAACSGNKSVTYAQLNRAANQFGHSFLEHLGAGSEPVLLLLKQGLTLIEAILAVLKSGKFYVSLDPSDPPDLLSSLVDDCSPRLMVCDQYSVQLAEQIAPPDCGILNVSTPKRRCTGSDLTLRISPHSPAYLFYTSGSTGKPKAVIDTHRNVLHNVRRYTNSLFISNEDRLSLLQRCCFSGSVSSLFGALLNGAAVFPFDVQEKGAHFIADWILREGITIYHSVPSLFRSFQERSCSFPSIRVVRLEGDRATRLDVDLFRRNFSDKAVLVNGLGITETGLVSQYFVTGESRVEAGSLPVGYPVEGMEILILDREGRRLPAGQIGEIAVRSRFLAQGYWDDPERTARAFRTDLVNPDVRIYRTGDVGRIAHDGCLEYLGRRDSRIKIRGHAVEPGAVESALNGLEGVEDSAVLVEQHRETPRLFACVVCSSDKDSLEIDLRRQLRKRLPAHMIPARIIALDQLPLTANGKIDRESLKLIIASRDQSPHCIELQSEGHEKKLCRLWGQVLDRPGVQPGHDFFDLGGDSLAAVRLLLAIEDGFGVRLPYRSLIEAPTPLAMAGVVERFPSDPVSGSSMVAFRREGEKPPLFCVHGGDGHVLFYQGLAQCLGPKQPFYAFESPGLDGDGSPLPTVEAMASRYIQEMREVVPRGPYRLAGYCLGAYVALEMALQLHHSGQEVSFLASFDADGEWRCSRGMFPGIGSHWKIFRQLQPGRRLDYLRERCDYRTTRIRRFLRVRLPGRDLHRRARVVSELNLNANRKYRPRSSFQGCLCLFQSHKHRHLDPASFWGPLVKGGIQVVDVPGDDLTMFRAPDVEVLASRLRESLRFLPPPISGADAADAREEYI